MLIAIPSDTTDGLNASISQHFGHCAAFTLVDVKDGAIGEVSIIENSAHQQGGCMSPVTLLKENGVNVLISGGMGARPLSGFQQAGIDVHFKEGSASVQEAIELFLDGGCRSFSEEQTCGSGEGGCGHHHEHHHGEPQIVAIDGPADVREGRMITLDFELNDATGGLLDSSEQSGPLRFVFGAGQILPAIERAVAGLEPEAHVVQEIPKAEGYGERDETRILEVSRSKLPQDVSVGDVLAGQDNSGTPFPLTVLSIDGEIAQLDANHPFAGKDLVFDLTVRNVEGIKSQCNH